MVRGLEKYMNQVAEIAKDSKVKTEEAERVLRQVQLRMENNRRKPRSPAPEGGISIRKAAIRYKVPATTISGWKRRGWLPIKLETKNEIYVDEKTIAELAKVHKRYQRRGSKKIKEIMSK